MVNNSSDIKNEYTDGDNRIENLYRGIWANRLEDGQILPVGGNMFNNKLDRFLRLDFMNFGINTNIFFERATEAYKIAETDLKKWMAETGIDVDPWTYYLCAQIQKHVSDLLEDNPDDHNVIARRNQKYANNTIPNLSDLKGCSKCAEKAALGQFLLQLGGVKSAYISGIVHSDPANRDISPCDHSFIIIRREPDKEDTVIFDIAHPHTGTNLPRISKTEFPLNYELLAGQSNLLVKAREILVPHREIYYGVGPTGMGIARKIKDAA